MVRVLTVGPNAGLQKVLTFPTLEVGGVNRASHVTSYCGGKGQGAALALNIWEPGSAAVASFLGGDSGVFCEDVLTSAGLDTITEKVASTTRTCTTLLCDGEATELIDPSDPISAAEVDALTAKVTAAASTFDAVALCGTSPPGAEALYERVCSKLPPEPLLLLDGFKQVEAVLASGRLDVLKLNCDELRALTGAADVAAAARELLGDGGALRRANAVLALTDGPRPASIFSSTGAWEIEVPRVDCVNAIGAGDVCTGVFIHELAKARKERRVDGAAAAEAFAWGLAAASARCTVQLPSGLEPAKIRELRERVAIRPM